jgi:diguanylate cyclase (GGDEF)-like protein
MGVSQSSQRVHSDHALMDVQTTRTLVIEDDSSLLPLIREVLGQVGCGEIRFVASGTDAIAAAASFAPDLVLLDLGLPDMDGIDVCRALSGMLPAVPILIITARNDDSVVEIAFEAGAEDYVAKPFRLGELGARVRSALRLRSERVVRRLRDEELAARTRALEISAHELERAVCIDALTGVANRGHFDDLLTREWNRAERQGSPLSLVIVDVDLFHAFNEHYSHVGGDACLKAISSAMADCLRRPSDVLARYGGEEFVALLPDTAAAGACVVAERLRAAVEELSLPHAGSDCAKVVTISAGVATLASQLHRPAAELVSAADGALFRAKHDGRNCWRADVSSPAHVVVSRRPWPVCPIVCVDPYLALHIPRFLENRRTEIERLREAARADDLGAVRAVGHKLKGSGGTFGFDDLSVLGERLEKTSERADALRTLDELGWYLEHVHVVYRRPSEEARSSVLER